jgi:hypothetical protein
MGEAHIIGLVEAGEFATALERGRELIATRPCGPGLVHLMARLNLALGNFGRGMELLDRLRPAKLFGDPPLPTQRPLWDGSDPRGKTICLATEGGLGDIVCFARFAQDLQKLGAEVVVATDSGMFSILKSLEGLDSVVDKVAPDRVPFDCWLPALSAPRALGMTPADLSGRAYLQCPLDAAAKWSRLLTEAGPNHSSLKVALCWQGRGDYAEDHLRSIAGARLKPLLDQRGVAWHKAQLWEGANTLTDDRIIDLTKHIACVDDLAGLLTQMDLLITVDSGPAHLAAALGVETWLLNRFFGWITFVGPSAAGPRHSPWYSAMRVYTQTNYGDWDEPVRAVTDDLAARVASAESA